jgi:ABC-type Fe2+-enterobactin transport system substrate-binding protein
MPTAWEAFHSSIQILAGPDSQRSRLAQACSEHLTRLSKRDVPAEIRDEFLQLLTGTVKNRDQSDRSSIMETLSSVEDREVYGMINAIVRMYDAVTRYEPILSSGLGPGRRPERGEIME